MVWWLLLYSSISSSPSIKLSSRLSRKSSRRSLMILINPSPSTISSMLPQDWLILWSVIRSYPSAVTHHHSISIKTDLGKIIRPNFISSTSTFHLAPPTSSFPLDFFLMFLFRQSSPQNFPCPIPILMLTSGILHRDCDTSGNMGQAHCRFRLVDVLNISFRFL